MQITITGHQVDLTAALKRHINEKMHKIERHFDHVSSIDVILHIEKLAHKAEATINSKGVTLHAQATSENMYSSIDSLSGKLDSQVLKHKEKTTNHHRNQGGLKRQSFN